MSLFRLSAQTLRLAARPTRASLRCTLPALTSTTSSMTTRWMSKNPWSDRDRGAEAAYFNRDDSEKLESLLGKLTYKFSPEGRAAASARLDDIFAKHGTDLSEDLREALLDWKVHKDADA